MDLSRYLNKKVQIVLVSGFTYIGRVINADKDSITLIDKNNSEVCLKEESIELLKEVNWNLRNIIVQCAIEKE